MPRRYANTDAPVITPELEKPLLDQDGLAVILLNTAEKRISLKNELLDEIQSVQEYAEGISESIVLYKSEINQTIENVAIAAIQNLPVISDEAIDTILSS